LVDCVGFIVFTTLASYSDYSFLSMFIFYLLTLILVVKIKKERLSALLLTYGITFILVLPGMFQLLFNLNTIKGLNAHLVGDLSLPQAFLKFCEMTILHLNSPTTLLLFVFYLTLFVIEVFFVANRKSSLDRDKITFFLLIGTSYYLSTLCFLLINQYVFKVFVERATWFFPLFSLIMISILIHSFYVKKKYIYVLIIITFTLTRMSNMFITEGDVAYEMSYKSFLDAYALDKEASDDKYLLIIDNGYVLYPLRYYYLYEPGAIRNARVGAATKQLLSQRKFRSLYTDKIKSYGNLPSLPSEIKYSVVVSACDDVDLKNIFFKGAQSIYCVQSKDKNDYIFVKKK